MDKTGLSELNLGERDAGRLSQVHIRSQIVGEEPAKVVLYPNSTIAKVTREMLVKVCVDCGKEFRVEKYKSAWVDRCVMCRSVLKTCVHCGIDFVITGREQRTLKEIECPACGGVNPGCVRGEVTRFSEDSKHRLMKKLNQVRKGISKVHFVTLTVPDEYHEFRLNPERWKSDLRRFEHRFRRAFPGGAFVWRLEIETRKSGLFVGETFPHFHLLVFNVQLGLLRDFVAEHWHEVAGQGSEKHLKVHSHVETVKPVISRKGVMSYASKAVGSVMSRELAKDLQAKGNNVGRWWGVAVKDIFKLFLADEDIYEMTDADAVQFVRLFRNYIHRQSVERWRKAGKRWKKPKLTGFSFPSLTVFLDADRLKENLVRVLSPGGSWAFQSTGRRYNVPFLQWAYDTGKLGEPELVTA